MADSTPSPRPRPGWRAVAFRALATGAVVYLAVVALMFGAQRSLVYLPHESVEADDVARGAADGLIPWRADDGRLIGWRPAGSGAARRRLLVFHGNAGDALGRTVFVRGFGSLGGGREWEVVLAEYPGYGARPGAPTEASLTAAGVEALEQLLREDARPVTLLGESLGSGVAAQVARRRPDAVRGVVAVTPFSSMADVAAAAYPLVPVRYLLRDTWQSSRALRDYRGPLAVLLAGEDTVVPTRFGQRLYDGFGGPKRLWVQPDRGHNTLDLRPEAALWHEVAAFLTAPAAAP